MRKLLGLTLIYILMSATGVLSAEDAFFAVRTPIFAGYGYSGVGAYLGAESAYVNPSVLNNVSVNIFEACYGDYYAAMSTTTLMLTRSGELFGGSFAMYYGNGKINGLVQTEDSNHDTKPDTLGTMDYFGQTLHVSYYNGLFSVINYSIGLRYLEKVLGGINNNDHAWYGNKEKGSGFGYNLGLSTYPLEVLSGRLQFGLSVYDVGGTTFKWSTISEKIDQAVNTGVSWKQALPGFDYTLQADEGVDGLSYGAGIGLEGTGLGLSVGVHQQAYSVGVQYDNQALIAALAYVDHPELGGSYSFAVGFPIYLEEEKANIKKIQSEFSTAKSVTNNPMAAPTLNIDEEMKRLKLDSLDLLNKLDSDDFSLAITPETMLSGQKVSLRLQTKLETAEKVFIQLGDAKIRLIEENPADEGIPDKFKEFVNSKIVKTFVGTIKLPTEPGYYDMRIVFVNAEDRAEFTKFIHVK